MATETLTCFGKLFSSESSMINGCIFDEDWWGGAVACLMNRKIKLLLLRFYWLHCWWHSGFIPKVNWTWTQKIKRLSRVTVTAGPSGNSPLKWLLIRFVKGLSSWEYNTVNLVKICCSSWIQEYWFSYNIILTKCRRALVCFHSSHDKFDFPAGVLISFICAQWESIDACVFAFDVALIPCMKKKKTRLFQKTCMWQIDCWLKWF